MLRFVLYLVKLPVVTFAQAGEAQHLHFLPKNKKKSHDVKKKHLSATIMNIFETNIFFYFVFENDN